MKEYQKIPAVFKRDTQTHKLIPEYISPEVEYLANNLWSYSEKVDGTNTQINWDGHVITLGGRTEKAQIPDPLKSFLETNYVTHEMEEVFEQLFGDKDVTIYGEGYGYKITIPQHYNGNNVYFKDKGVGFRVFDVNINGYYLSKDNMIDVAQKLGMEHIEILGYATLPQLIDKMKTHPNSPLIEANTGNQYEMEGYVATPAVPMYNNKGERIIVKIKWKDVKELVQ